MESNETVDTAVRKVIEDFLIDSNEGWGAPTTESVILEANDNPPPPRPVTKALMDSLKECEFETIETLAGVVSLKLSRLQHLGEFGQFVITQIDVGAEGNALVGVKTYTETQEGVLEKDYYVHYTNTGQVFEK